MGLGIFPVQQLWDFAQPHSGHSRVGCEDSIVVPEDWKWSRQVTVWHYMDPASLPLFSMIVEGLPPLQQLEYVHEAEEGLNQFVDRHHRITSLDFYCRVSLTFASYIHLKISASTISRRNVRQLQYG